MIAKSHKSRESSARMGAGFFNMKKAFLLGAVVWVLVMMTACGIPYDREFVIHPSDEMQTDTLVAADTTSDPNSAKVALRGHSNDTLYLSFSNGRFWEVKLIGDIDTIYRNEWYDVYLPITYYTKTTNDDDSVEIQYWIN